MEVDYMDKGNYGANWKKFTGTKALLDYYLKVRPEQSFMGTSFTS